MRYFILTTFLFTSFAHAISYIVEVKESELQAKAEELMPFTKKSFIFTVTMSSPIIDLKPNSNRIWLSCNIQIKASDITLGIGDVVFNGNLKYDNKTGGFFFYDVILLSLNIDTIPAKSFPKIKSLVEDLGNKFLVKKPIYKLKDAKLTEELTKSLLKSIRIADEKLYLEIGF
jgi:hypothetical protein